MRLTAHVLLRSRDGSVISTKTEITKNTIAKLTPKQSVTDDVHRRLSALGFAVTARGGLSLTITAEMEHFGRVFGTPLTVLDDGSACVISKRAEPDRELPLEKLPPELRVFVTAVTFESQPEFGPISFF